MKATNMNAAMISATTGTVGAAPRGTVTTWIKALFEGLRSAAATRALRRQLAEMDDALLRDIGIGEDEIWQVRHQHRFTPRAWH